MEARHRNPELVLDLGVKIDIVCGHRQRRRLDGEAYWSRVAALDRPLVSGTKSLSLAGIPGKLRAAASGINRIPANKFFLVRIFQVLPAGHPRHSVVADAIGEAGLSQQLRQISAGGLAVKVVAEVPPKLSARVRNSIRPVPGLGIEQDAGRFQARRGDYNRTRKYLDFLIRLAADIGHAPGHP